MHEHTHRKNPPFNWHISQEQAIVSERSFGSSTLAHVLMDHSSEQKQKKDCHRRFGCWIDVSFIQTWADINLPGCPFLHRRLFMIYDPSHNTHSSHNSWPSGAYPYNQIRSPGIETQAHNLLLDTFCSDQSLFRCCRGGFKVLLAGGWELRTCMCVAGNIQSQVSDSFVFLDGQGFILCSRSECWGESLVIISEGCCFCDLFSTKFALVYYTIITTSSMTVFLTNFLSYPYVPLLLFLFQRAACKVRVYFSFSVGLGGKQVKTKWTLRLLCVN